MKSLSTGALLLLGAIATAQSDSWYAARFGFNAPAADLFANQNPTDYKNFAYNEGQPGVRWNASVAAMTGAGLVQPVNGRAWNDPGNHLWADLFEMTDLLPKNTWVRVTANLSNHYPNPVNKNGHSNPQRDYDAIVGRIMFRGSDLKNGLNILWNLTPGVYPYTGPSDGWSTITTDPWGNKLPNPINTGDPATRDWWRPQTAYYPYLRNNVQQFVYDVNNCAANIVRKRSPAGTLTENFIARMGFQLGNEPAAGHPGGSIDGAVGSWTGVGSVLEATTSNIDYRPYPAVMRSDLVPAAFGTNPLTMPAFSMFSETPDTYRINYVKGQLRNIQWGGPVSPGLNEIATYSKEMVGFNWPTHCSRRALHFNSPQLRWGFNPRGQYQSTDHANLLTSSLIDPTGGRWETPQEYAKRWVAELTRQVDIVASLSMPGNSKLVDVTECYFTGGQSAATQVDSTMKYGDGSSPNFQSMTFDQIRTMARSFVSNNGVLTPLPQLPPSRESLLAAIRTELYNQDMAGTLTPSLGRIYWWGGFYADPRTEAGLMADANNNVNGYSPWSDYRLTLSEVKALWNKP